MNTVFYLIVGSVILMIGIIYDHFENKLDTRFRSGRGHK